MNDPTFTVVMAAYNAGRTVEAAIRSVLNQTRSDFELIVVDDGSTDSTASIVGALARDERIHLVRQQENCGVAVARNTALERAKGTYVSLIDSDDLWLPEYLERVESVLAGAPPEAAFVYVDAWVFDNDTGRVRRQTAAAREVGASAAASPDGEGIIPTLLRRNFVYGAATIRMSALADVGFFDSTLRASEDYELWLRLVVHGYRPIQIEEPLAVYRQRSGQLTSDSTLMLETLRAVYQRIADDTTLDSGTRAAAERRTVAVDRELGSLSGRYTVARTMRGCRTVLGRVRRRVLRRRLWHENLPPALARAFPELGRSSA